LFLNASKLPEIFATPPDALPIVPEIVPLTSPAPLAPADETEFGLKEVIFTLVDPT
jgi:hypothetical protein